MGDAPVLVQTSVRRVDLTGADRLRYLEDVTSQAFADATPGDVHPTLYLDAHGAPLAMFDAAVLADRVALLAPDDEVVATLLDVLGMRTFLLDATFTLTDDVVLALRGPGAGEVAAAANLAARPGTVRPAGDEVVVIGRGGGLDGADDGGVDVVGPAAAADAVAALLRDAGARDGTADDLEAWRVASGIPAWGAEVVAPHLPEEAGLLPTHVHLAKGCYPGQEAVARMWMLGRPRRRLALVAQVAGGDHGHAAPIEPGWEAGSGRRKVTVTSVSPAGDRALAFVPADAEAGARYGGDGDGTGSSAQVEVLRLVGEGLEVPGHDPAVPRRRDRAVRRSGEP